MLILLKNLPFNGTAMMYVEIPKCKLKMRSKLFHFQFFNENPSYKEKRAYNFVSKQINERKKTLSTKLNADFLMFLFAKNTQSYM